MNLITIYEHNKPVMWLTIKEFNQYYEVTK